MQFISGTMEPKASVTIATDMGVYFPGRFTFRTDMKLKPGLAIKIELITPTSTIVADGVVDVVTYCEDGFNKVTVQV